MLGMHLLEFLHMNSASVYVWVRGFLMNHKPFWCGSVSAFVCFHGVVRGGCEMHSKTDVLKAGLKATTRSHHLAILRKQCLLRVKRSRINKRARARGVNSVKGVETLTKLN